MASSSGTTPPAIARLVAANDDTVRAVIHTFNATGLAALDPHWAGGRPRLISDTDIEFIVVTALARPKTLGMPFTHWSLRKLSAYLRGTYRRTAPVPTRQVTVGRERLRQILHHRRITFQHTRTWKESTDPDADAKLDRIEHLTTRFPDRCGNGSGTPSTAQDPPAPPPTPTRTSRPGDDSPTPPTAICR